MKEKDMRFFTQPRLNKSVRGIKIRIQRITLQLVLIGLMVYYYGWWSLLFNFVIIWCEVLPVTWFDKINPWFRSEYKKFQEEELFEELLREFPDLSAHRCAFCDKSVLTIDVSPPWNDDANLHTTGVWVDPGEGKSFILCDECSEEQYKKES